MKTCEICGDTDEIKNFDLTVETKTPYECCLACSIEAGGSRHVIEWLKNREGDEK